VEHTDPDRLVLSGLDDPVRRRLYEFVAGCEAPVSRDEAAAAAGVGRPLAAYHLDKLVGLGLLAASYQRPAGRTGPGAGRPAKLYVRSGGEFIVTVPSRSYGLAARLLATAVESGSGDASRVALRDAAWQFGSDLGTRSIGTGPAAADARQAAASILRAQGFEPWQAEDGTMRLRNCPFHQLAAEHREVICGMNLALIEGLVAGLGASQLHPALDPQPGCCCVAISAGKIDAGEPACGRARADAS
jgi:predicted ArsR family transcriptional regulator